MLQLSDYVIISFRLCPHSSTNKNMKKDLIVYVGIILISVTMCSLIFFYLSPAQVLFGKPLRDTLPGINKDTMVFNNDQIASQWRDAWRIKEEAMKARYVKTVETLQEHARELPPLRHGDNVMVQNQSGRFPTRWDKSGCVVEVKDNDQYVVKVAGTGRMTLRNRRFLR